MKRLSILTLLLTLLAPTVQAGDNTLLGTAAGAALGGYLGSTIGKGSGQLAATGAGVFIGGALGNSIGHSMDRAESYSYAPSYYNSYGWNAQPSYEPNYVAPPSIAPRVIYVQPDVIEYRPSPSRVYVEEGYVGPPAGGRKRHCREFTQTIKIDGKTHESYGTACLRPDGTWQIEP